jgi:hypothetical protein
MSLYYGDCQHSLYNKNINQWAQDSDDINGFFGVVEIKGLTIKGAQVRDIERSNFHDFYIIKPSWMGDFGAKL